MALFSLMFLVIATSIVYKVEKEDKRYGINFLIAT
jgi:hypothetical protein